MAQVKHITEIDDDKFQKSINRFLDYLDKEDLALVDIKYSVNMDRIVDTDCLYVYSALIIYK